MRLRSNRYSPLVAAVATLGLASHSFADYTLTNIFRLPYASNDGTAAATPVTYSALNLTSVGVSVSPQGPYLGTSTELVAQLTSGKNSNNSSSISNVFTYDPTNGVRFVGEHLENSIGSESSSLKYQNAIGDVLGYSSRNAADSASTGTLGQDSWLYVPAASGPGTTYTGIGLTGQNFQYTVNYANTSAGTSVGTFTNSTASYVNASLVTAGTNNRYAGDGSSATSITATTGLGSSAWVSTAGGAATEVGLFGAGYSYSVTTNSTTLATGRYSSNGVLGVDTAGRVYGSATPYYDKGTGTTSAGTSLGLDGWVYSGGVATTIGLYQSGMSPNITNFPTISYANTTTVQPTRYTTLNSPTAAGIISGYSQLYTSAGGYDGQDAFLYNANTAAYTQVGLVSDGFASGATASSVPAGTTSYVGLTGQRNSAVAAVNATGQSAGTSYKYVGTGSAVNQGAVAWFTPAAGSTGSTVELSASALNDPHTAGTVQSGSTGAYVYTANGTVSGSVTQLTDSGLVGGYYLRYRQPGSSGTVSATSSALGQDAFVYNSTTGATTILDSTDAASDNFFSDSILYLSNDGVAVGQYTAGNPLRNFNYEAFIWSQSTGFVDLGSTIAGSLSQSGYQNLITAYFDGSTGNPIYSTAGIVNTASNSTTVQGLVSLSGTVPEPASLSVLSLGAMGMLRLRRKLA